MPDILNALHGIGVSPLLVAVVFAASCIQAITGIGFGVIAGPVLLVSMGSASAIQVSIALSFLIALLLAPGTVPRVSRTLLAPLIAGVLLGTPLGALAYVTLSLGALKLLAAIVVGFMTLIATGWLTRHPLFERDNRKRRIPVGMVSGFLNTTLAMPGPPVAAYATAIRSDKQTIRATTLVTFLFAYPVSLAFQGIFAGLSPDLVDIALPLATPTVLGTVSGMLIAPLFSEQFFKWLTVAFLSASVFALLSG